ncbi:hypothetical protein GCM10011519_18660 [Marmoricola endophyticus]|uniref:DUF3180 domain-containing protein n=1 Tax=Marmoricola endophyticus TaxID=2040280 RepID=A0A917BL78_9ACTN|nr:DUF3180 family protein [Marmoricola endophyticus]GGF45094.1 hypothetical protein GCM10011519_18660 [Marmoricola endophyticus]
MSPEQQPPGRPTARPTRPGPLVVAGCVAAVAGWAIRPVAAALGRPQPLVGWSGVVVVWLLGLAVGFVALRTWLVLQRAVAKGDVKRRATMEPYQAVNRMVLGKAAAVVGALVVGGYAGYALSQLGVPVTPLTGDRVVRALVAVVGGVLLVVAGLLLERACRVREDDKET